MAKYREKRLTAGDHVWVKRNWGPIPFEHHGIYVGEDVVIHFSRGKVRWTTLEKFQVGEKLHITVRKESRQNTRVVVVERARSLLGMEGYQILYLNCEHFAEFCVTGVLRSKQVEEWHLNVLADNLWAFADAANQARFAGRANCG